MYNRPDQVLAQLPSRYNFYKRKSENRYVRPARQSCCPYIAIIAIKKAKIAKDVLDKKFPAGTAAPALLL